MNYGNEFSPNSRFLYYFSGANLVQLDIHYSSYLTIQNSTKTILQLISDENSSNPGSEIRIAPDGKIYFYYYDVINHKRKLGRINNPNEKGDLCNAELNVADINSDYPYFPNFVTSFLRENQDKVIDKVFADAGTDMELCSRSSIKIGNNGNNQAMFQWFPDEDLSDPFLSQPIYTAPVIYGSPATKFLVLRATDKNCWVNFDTAAVVVNPIPQKLPIDGSWSVCPSVSEVDY